MSVKAVRIASDRIRLLIEFGNLSIDCFGFGQERIEFLESGGFVVIAPKSNRQIKAVCVLLTNSVEHLWISGELTYGQPQELTA